MSHFHAVKTKVHNKNKDFYVDTSLLKGMLYILRKNTFITNILYGVHQNLYFTMNFVGNSLSLRRVKRPYGYLTRYRCIQDSTS